MIRFTTSDRTLASTRLAPSPLWELIGSLYLIGQRRVSWPYERWAGHARKVMARRECDPLWLFVGRPSEYPDFLGAPPRGDAEDELAGVAATDPGEVRRQVREWYGEDVPPLLQPYAVDPAGELARLAEAYAFYWRMAMADLTPVIEDITDEEMLRRSQVMATAGVDALLGSLGGEVRWQRPRLDLLKPNVYDIDARERRLVLVPVVFGAGCTCVAWHDDSVYVAYQAAGAARLSGTEPAHRTTPLARLLGSGRAAVLSALAEPASTRALASRFGLAPSTVSGHLTALRDAGVVVRRRGGRRVYYQVNDRGRALLEALGD